MRKKFHLQTLYLTITIIFLALAIIIFTAINWRSQKRQTTKANPAALTIRRGDPYKKMVSLTFDSALIREDDDTADKILDILKEKNIKCTMFLTGKLIENHPDLVKRIVQDGHEVGSHGYSHTHFDDLTNRQFIEEMEKTRTLFFQTTGQEMTQFWRPPGDGRYRSKILLAKKLGFGPPVVKTYLEEGNISLSLDSYDWVKDKNSPNYHSAEENRDRLLTPINKNGGIFLFHLESRPESRVVSTLPGIIDGLEAQGYQIVPVSTLLANKVY